MPAVNPRITITLTPEVHAVLRRLSALGGESQSAIVGGLLEQSLPVFQRMAQVLDAAKSAKEAMSSEMASGLEAAQAQVERQLGIAFEALDSGFRPILEAAERVERRGSTPMSNRGVRSTPKAQKATVSGGQSEPSTELVRVAKKRQSRKTRPVVDEGANP